MGMDKTVDLPLALPAGTVLAGKYVILQALGQGGFGITYAAEDHKTKEKIAIKEFFPDTMATRGQNNDVTVYSGSAGENFVYGKDCFLEEAKTLAKFIGNENIVKVISYFEENGTAYFAMEYIQGESFQDYIKAHGGKISWEETAKILLPVMDALSIVHSQGIIHRDVTPDNIYITKDGVVKLLDFGAARYSLGDKSRSLDVVLKHGFAPKEQYTRHGRQGPYTDVYTVGASFYFALTGKKPPDAIDRMEEDDLIPPTNLGAELSPEAEDAILKALNVQPAERFSDIAAFKHALTDAGKENQSDKTPSQQNMQDNVEHTVSQDPSGPAKVIQKKDKKMYIMLACAAGVIVVLLGTIGILLAGRGKNDDLKAVVLDDQGGGVALDAPDKSNDNVIINESVSPQTAAVVEENMDENSEVTEETEDQEDDAYSFENLGYDYEKEMEWEGHSYYVFSAARMTWAEALSDAVSYGGYLARINSESEMEYILSLLEEYKDIYRYVYVGGARDSRGSDIKAKKSYCWVDYNMGYLKKQYISGSQAEDNYKWLDSYWMEGEPSFTDDSQEEQVLEFLYYNDRWQLNDVSEEFPYLDGVDENARQKIGYVIEIPE